MRVVVLETIVHLLPSIVVDADRHERVESLETLLGNTFQLSGEEEGKKEAENEEKGTSFPRRSCG